MLLIKSQAFTVKQTLNHSASLADAPARIHLAEIKLSAVTPEGRVKFLAFATLAA